MNFTRQADFGVILQLLGQISRTFAGFSRISKGCLLGSEFCKKKTRVLGSKLTAFFRKKPRLGPALIIEVLVSVR